MRRGAPAVRAACPGIPLSLSTSAAIEPDPERRHALVAGWTELPDLVTANQGEDGSWRCASCYSTAAWGSRPGSSPRRRPRFPGAGLPPRCVRVLLEPLDPAPADAVAHAAAMEHALADGGAVLEQVHHGDGIASWAVNRRAAERGHGIRTGLEDTPVLPDGRTATGNGELVAAAAALLDRGAPRLASGPAGSLPASTTRVGPSRRPAALLRHDDVRS